MNHESGPKPVRPDRSSPAELRDGLEKRREAVDKLYLQAIQIREEAQQQFREMGALKRQLETREAALRQEGLQLELDREQLARERAALAGERARPLSAPATPGRVQAPAAGRRLAWTAATMLAAAAAGAAAWAWLEFERPVYRATQEVRIESTRDEPVRVLGEYLALALDPATHAAARGDSTSRPAGATEARSPSPRAASPDVAAGTVRALLQRNGIELTLSGPEAQAVADELAVVVARLVEHFRSLPAERLAAPRLAEWQGIRDVVAAELDEALRQRDATRARLADVPDAAAWQRLQEQYQQRQTAFREADAQLRDARDQLAALEAEETPRGVVTPEALAAALADDAVHAEDLKELAAEAEAEQRELLAAMERVQEPLRLLGQAAAALRLALIEQCDLQPPTEVRAVLEAGLTQLDGLERKLSEGAADWSVQRSALEELRLPEQAGELLAAQGRAAAHVQVLLREAEQRAASISAQVNALAEKPGVRTRELVVANALRGGLSRLAATVVGLARAARDTDVQHNFRLDAHDRQVRNLRVRLDQQADALGHTLQQRADEAARANRDRRLRELRAQIDALQRTRDEQMSRVAGALAELRRLEECTLELREAAAELRAHQLSIARLEQRRRDIDAQRPEILPDRFEVGELHVEPFAGTRRAAHASVAAGVTFAAVWLLQGLLILVQRRVVLA